MPDPVTCHYCGRPAERVSGEVIYPHRPDLGRKWFWRCEPCGAYVGCHPKSCRPLGSLANEPLRRLRNRAHAAFDPLWQESKISRDQAYKWLSLELEIPFHEAHIGMFNEDQCRQTIEAAGRFRMRGRQRA